LPILISVSLAPVSYFFWANALPAVSSNAAAEIAARRDGSRIIRVFSLEVFYLNPTI
jgi:hypothetical protein